MDNPPNDNRSTGIADDPTYLQISIPIQSGNSGGPVVNAAGEVVGVVTSKLNATQMQKATGDLTQNINFAIKSQFAEALLKGLGTKRPPAKKAKVMSIEDAATHVKQAIVLIHVR